MPSRMRLVRSIAAAMNSSGEEMISTPPEWCSPIQASANPMPLEVLDGLELSADRTRRIDVQRQQPRRHEGAEPQSLAVDGGRSGHRRTLMRDVT